MAVRVAPIHTGARASVQPLKVQMNESSARGKVKPSAIPRLESRASRSWACFEHRNAHHRERRRGTTGTTTRAALKLRIQGLRGIEDALPHSVVAVTNGGAVQRSGSNVAGSQNDSGPDGGGIDESQVLVEQRRNAGHVRCRHACPGQSYAATTQPGRKDSHRAHIVTGDVFLFGAGGRDGDPNLGGGIVGGRRQ